MAKKTNRKRTYKGSKRALVTNPYSGLFSSSPINKGYSRNVPVQKKRRIQHDQMVEGQKPIRRYYKKAGEKYKSIRHPFSTGFAMLKEKV